MLVEVGIVGIVGRSEEEEEEEDQLELMACEAVKRVESSTRYTAALPQVTCTHI